MKHRQPQNGCTTWNLARFLALASIAGIGMVAGQNVCSTELGVRVVRILKAEDTDIFKGCTILRADITVEGEDEVDLHDLEEIFGDLYIPPNSTISSLTAKNLRRISQDFTIAGEMYRVSESRPPTYTEVENLKTLALDSLVNVGGNVFISGVNNDADFNIGLSGNGITAGGIVSVEGSAFTKLDWFKLKRMQGNNKCLTVQYLSELETLSFPDLESVPCLAINGTGSTNASFASLRNVGLGGRAEWIAPDDSFYINFREAVAGLSELSMPALVELTDLSLAENTFTTSEMRFPNLEAIYGRFSFLDNTMEGLPNLSLPKLTTAREIIVHMDDRLNGLDLDAVTEIHNLTLVGDITGVKMKALQSVEGNIVIDGNDINCTPFDAYRDDAVVKGEYSCDGAHLDADVDTIGADEIRDDNNDNDNDNPDRSDPDGSTGMSTAAKAGVGVGVGLGVPLIAVVAFLLWRRRKKQEATDKEAEEATIAETATPLNAQDRDELDGKEKPAELGPWPPGEMPVEVNGEPRPIEMCAETRPVQMHGYMRPAELP